jgi:hypothetical protein
MFKNLSISGETQLMWPVEWIVGDRCVKYRYVKKPQYIWGDTVNVTSRIFYTSVHNYPFYWPH